MNEYWADPLFLRMTGRLGLVLKISCCMLFNKAVFPTKEESVGYNKIYKLNNSFNSVTRGCIALAKFSPS